MSQNTSKRQPSHSVRRLVSALEEIRTRAMDHPCFDVDCFQRRDIDALIDQGGDIFDWTIVAILADDALRLNAEPSQPGQHQQEKA